MKALLIRALQIQMAQGLHKNMTFEQQAKCIDSLYLFILDRLEEQLRRQGHRSNVIKAVIDPIRENSMENTKALLELFKDIEEFKKEGSKADVVGPGEGMDTDRGE